MIDRALVIETTELIQFVFVIQIIINETRIPTLEKKFNL